LLRMWISVLCDPRCDLLSVRHISLSADKTPRAWSVPRVLEITTRTTLADFQKIDRRMMSHGKRVSITETERRTLEDLESCRPGNGSTPRR
jgi:hypothetical protein